MTNHIVCVKWGNKYISQYANVLYNMCKRNSTVDYEFHCITEINVPTDDVSFEDEVTLGSGRARIRRDSSSSELSWVVPTAELTGLALNASVWIFEFRE